MRTGAWKKGIGATLAIAGLVLILAGTGVGLGHADEDAPSDGAASRQAAGPSGSTAVLGVRAGILGLGVDEEVRAPPTKEGLPPVLPHRFERSTQVDLPVADGHLALDLAVGGGPAGRDAPVETASAQASDSRGVPLAGAAVLAGLALTSAGALVWSWGSLKTWAFRVLVVPLVPLYARVSRAEVFDNSVRERIFQAIREHPGIAASDLSRRASVSWGTTMYHLEVLEQTRMVTSVRNGRYRRYFENGAALAASKQTVALLQNEMTATVVETLRTNPGATQKDLARAVGLTPQALHWHLTRLVAHGLVRKERDGRVVRHFTEPVAS